MQWKLTIGAWSSVDNTVYYLLETRIHEYAPYKQYSLALMGLSGYSAAQHKRLVIAHILGYIRDEPIVIVDRSI